MTNEVSQGINKVKLGIIYREEGKYDLAINCFQQILNDERNWEFEYIRNNVILELGITYHLQGQLDLAIDCFEDLLDQESDDDDHNDDYDHFYRHRYSSLLELGLIYRELGELDTAIEYFQELIDPYIREDTEDRAWHELFATYEMRNNHKTAELIRVGTLLSANTLTTGLAHEIKNPLAGIQLTVSNLLGDLEDGTFEVNTLRADLLKIQSNASRINDRIGQARRLADDTLDPTKPPSTDMVEIKQLFQHTLEGFQQQLSIENITVELEVADNLPLIEANAIALEQVLANLISNAIDALRGQHGGTIRLAAEFVEPHMVITCHDTGAGIEVEEQRRIFEPLFTTKSRGQGTGIGLWLCKMIIEHWHGTIHFDSSPTQGTTFTVTLPLKQEES